MSLLSLLLSCKDDERIEFRRLRFALQMTVKKRNCEVLVGVSNEAIEMANFDIVREELERALLTVRKKHETSGLSA